MRLIILLTALLLSPNLFAQITVHTKPSREAYLSYEPIDIQVTITNQAGRPLTLRNTGNNSWIEFVVKNQSGRVVGQVAATAYAGTTIPTGETIRSSFTLNNHYDLALPGNYSVYAVVRTPEQNGREGTRSNQGYFTVNRGVPSWKAKVGVPGVAGDQREYRLIDFNNGSSPQLYVQVEDVRLGRMLACYSMGRNLSFRQALKAIDRENKLHVLFMTTPELYCYTIVNTSGDTVKRLYHKAIGSTKPYLHTHDDGSVVVANSVLYDPEKEAEEQKKFHSLSEVPGGFEQ
ncbi:hypothetical protein ACFPK9_08845 [Rubritalea spongiae]|uniref:Uncharacterized protein n=1 Tax=Rubritalea spongiae TaxID=430797 RepID=A0ABW5E0U4_9BACT